MAVSKAADKTVSLVLVGRRSQYVSNLGILRRGKAFSVSEKLAAKFLASKNNANGNQLFVTEEAYKEMQKPQTSNSSSLSEATQASADIGGGVEEV